MTADQPQRMIYRVHPKRLEIGRGDICLSFSADLISAGLPLRAPFGHAGERWICTDMGGGGTATSGLPEFEAYRLSRVHSFAGKTFTFQARAGTEEARASAEADPNGFYHGVLVRDGRVKAVLRGPAAIFVARAITQRRKLQTPPAVAPEDVRDSRAGDDETASPASEAPNEPAVRPEPVIHAVPAARLKDDGGDIAGSYSADRIGLDQPVRRPFKYGGALWICTGITGPALNANGGPAHEAYRLVPERFFIGPPTTYRDKIGTAEGAETARRDPNGFYHGMRVRFAGAASVLCGPPVRFIAADRSDPNRPPEPEQLGLF